MEEVGRGETGLVAGVEEGVVELRVSGADAALEELLKSREEGVVTACQLDQLFDIVVRVE